MDREWKKRKRGILKFRERREESGRRKGEKQTKESA